MLETYRHKRVLIPTEVRKEPFLSLISVRLQNRNKSKDKHERAVTVNAPSKKLRYCRIENTWDGKIRYAERFWH
jgi:hypothetical protein